jgi:hypothetical protein
LLADVRTGQNRRHRLAGFLRQSVFSRLAHLSRCAALPLRSVYGWIS